MPKATDDYTQDMNKGGTIMDKQMKMAFMDNGGLQDDGMDRDPVSGNDVPSGSLAEEVRDDIPAQLSEGEYVVPADVVRFFGVKFFEDLRMQAKMGLAQMERSGRIGGEPIEDDGEMMDSNDEALIIAMTPDMNRGGLIGMANGGISDEDKEDIGVDRTPNPYRDTLMDYSFVGSSLFPHKKLTEETWYHPDGRSMTIKRDASGNVVPSSDSKFTQEPWSLGEPKDKDDDDVTITEDATDTSRDVAEPKSKVEKQEEKIKRWEWVNAQREKQKLKPIVFPGMNQDWYKNRQQSSVKLATNLGGEVLTDDYGQVVHLPEANYKAIKTSYDRFDKDVLASAGITSMNEYHKLSPLDRIKLTQYELKDELTDKDKEAIQSIGKKYIGEDGKFKGFNIVNPLASKAAGWVGDKLRGKDFLAGGEYVSPKQQELIEFLFKKQAAGIALNSTEADQLGAFKKVFGESGEEFVTDSGDTRFSAGFELPETPVSISDGGGGNSSDDLEETTSEKVITPTPKVNLAPETSEKLGIKPPGQRESKAEKAARQKRIDDNVAAWKAKQKKPVTKKEEQTAKGQETGKGYIGGSGFTKGGLASKPQPKPKKKRTTKGLGTKPKAT